MLTLADAANIPSLKQAAAPPRRSLTRRYIAEVFDGADEALAALDSVQSGLISTVFQSINWLTVLYEDLAPAKRALPRVVVVTERNSGEVALVLPLVVVKKNNLRIARFADLGVSNYGAPMLGKASLVKPRSIRRAWRAALQAMPDVDLIRLERMPAEIAGRPNPLMKRAGVVPSRMSGTVFTVDGSIEDYIRSRGKKFAKEVARTTRVWHREGAPQFARATTPEQIARAYSVLDEQQAARQTALGNRYLLDEAPYRAFYERLVMDGTDCGLGYLFTLEARGVVVATLFGVLHDDVFTCLRISFGQDRWSHLSPGRLIALETIKYMMARGVRRFDMGIGDYPYKRQLGARDVPLFDLIVARDLAALPKAAFHRFKARVRRHGPLRALVRRFLAKRVEE